MERANRSYTPMLPMLPMLAMFPKLMNCGRERTCDENPAKSLSLYRVWSFRGCDQLDKLLGRGFVNVSGATLRRLSNVDALLNSGSSPLVERVIFEHCFIILSMEFIKVKSTGYNVQKASSSRVRLEVSGYSK